MPTDLPKENAKCRIVCTTCGSDDILVDVWAAWEVASQERKVAETFENAVRNDCGGECLISELSL